MKSKSLFARCLAAGLAAVLMLTQVVFPHRAEANFWLERSQASRRLRQEDVAARAGAGEESARQRTLFASLAGLPLSTGAGAALDARISNGLDAAVPGLGRQAPAGETANKLVTALSARGTLRDIKGSVDFRSRPAAIVVLLQDIHHHAEAQNSLAEILRGILDVAPEAVVGLEGGAGRLDVAPFRLRSAKANATAAEFLKNAGLIGGAESVLLTAPRSVQAWGAEDPDLYLANVDAVRKAAPRRAASRLRLGSARRALQEAKARIYSPALADYDRRRSDHEAGRATLGGYVEYLAGVRSLPAPLADSALGRFLDTLRQEKALDMAAVKADRAALLEKLVVRLDRGTLDELLRASLAYRAGTLSTGVYYDYLRRSTARAGLPLDRFPRFAGYVRYVLSADAIRPEALWRELAEREAAVGRALCANGDQRALLEADGDLALVEKVVALSLTTDEWRRYQERRPRLRGLPASIRNWGGGDVSEEWKTDLSIFERFYVLAEERNAAMVERLWRVLPQSDPERVPVAVLVAGGFHAEGVGRLLSGRGAVSLVATPKLSGSVEGVPGPFELFAGEKAPLEEIFESPRITLAETLAVAGTIGQSARAAAARALGPLAGALTEAVEGAEAAAESPDGVRLERSPDGRGGIAAVRTARHTMYLSMAPSGETVPAIDKKLRGARAVLDRVAAGGHDFSVHTRRLSAAQRFAGWAARSARRVWPALARAGARGAKVLLIATVVFAATGLLFPAESLAYEFVRQGTEVVFTPTAGEHLWGAAKELLRLSGVEHATGGQIWDVVRQIGEANGLTDLDRIFAGQSYAVPSDLLPPGPTADVASPIAPSAAQEIVQGPVSTIESPVALPSPPADLSTPGASAASTATPTTSTAAEPLKTLFTTGLMMWLGVLVPGLSLAGWVLYRWTRSVRANGKVNKTGSTESIPSDLPRTETDPGAVVAPKTHPSDLLIYGYLAVAAFGLLGFAWVGAALAVLLTYWASNGRSRAPVGSNSGVFTRFAPGVEATRRWLAMAPVRAWSRARERFSDWSDRLHPQTRGAAAVSAVPVVDARAVAALPDPGRSASAESSVSSPAAEPPTRGDEIAAPKPHYRRINGVWVMVPEGRALPERPLGTSPTASPPSAPSPAVPERTPPSASEATKSETTFNEWLTLGSSLREALDVSDRVEALGIAKSLLGFLNRWGRDADVSSEGVLSISGLNGDVVTVRVVEPSDTAGARLLEWIDGAAPEMRVSRVLLDFPRTVQEKIFEHLAHQCAARSAGATPEDAATAANLLVAAPAELLGQTLQLRRHGVVARRLGTAAFVVNREVSGWEVGEVNNGPSFGLRDEEQYFVGGEFSTAQTLTPEYADNTPHRRSSKIKAVPTEAVAQVGVMSEEERHLRFATSLAEMILEKFDPQRQRVLVDGRGDFAELYARVFAAHGVEVRWVPGGASIAGLSHRLASGGFALGVSGASFFDRHGRAMPAEVLAKVWRDRALQLNEIQWMESLDSARTNGLLTDETDDMDAVYLARLRSAGAVPRTPFVVDVRRLKHAQQEAYRRLLGPAGLDVAVEFVTEGDSDALARRVQAVGKHGPVLGLQIHKNGQKLRLIDTDGGPVDDWQMALALVAGGRGGDALAVTPWDPEVLRAAALDAGVHVVEQPAPRPSRRHAVPVHGGDVLSAALAAAALIDTTHPTLASRTGGRSAETPMDSLAVSPDQARRVSTALATGRVEDMGRRLAAWAGQSFRGARSVPINGSNRPLMIVDTSAGRLWLWMEGHTVHFRASGRAAPLLRAARRWVRAQAPRTGWAQFLIGSGLYAVYLISAVGVFFNMVFVDSGLTFFLMDNITLLMDGFLAPGAALGAAFSLAAATVITANLFVFADEAFFAVLRTMLVRRFSRAEGRRWDLHPHLWENPRRVMADRAAPWQMRSHMVATVGDSTEIFKGLRVLPGFAQVFFYLREVSLSRLHAHRNAQDRPFWSYFLHTLLVYAILRPLAMAWGGVQEVFRYGHRVMVQRGLLRTRPGDTLSDVEVARRTDAVRGRVSAAFGPEEAAARVMDREVIVLPPVNDAQGTPALFVREGNEWVTLDHFTNGRGYSHKLNLVITPADGSSLEGLKTPTGGGFVFRVPATRSEGASAPVDSIGRLWGRPVPIGSIPSFADAEPGAVERASERLAALYPEFIHHGPGFFTIPNGFGKIQVRVRWSARPDGPGAEEPLGWGGFVRGEDAPNGTPEYWLVLDPRLLDLPSVRRKALLDVFRDQLVAHVYEPSRLDGGSEARGLAAAGDPAAWRNDLNALNRGQRAEDLDRTWLSIHPETGRVEATTPAQVFRALQGFLLLLSEESSPEEPLVFSVDSMAQAGAGAALEILTAHSARTGRPILTAEEAADRSGGKANRAHLDVDGWVFLGPDGAPIAREIGRVDRLNRHMSLGASQAFRLAPSDPNVGRFVVREPLSATTAAPGPTSHPADTHALPLGVVWGGMAVVAFTALAAVALAQGVAAPAFLIWIQGHFGLLTAAGMSVIYFVKTIPFMVPALSVLLPSMVFSYLHFRLFHARDKKAVYRHWLKSDDALVSKMMEASNEAVLPEYRAFADKPMAGDVVPNVWVDDIVGQSADGRIQINHRGLRLAYGHFFHITQSRVYGLLRALSLGRLSEGRAARWAESASRRWARMRVLLFVQLESQFAWEDRLLAPVRFGVMTLFFQRNSRFFFFIHYGLIYPVLLARMLIQSLGLVIHPSTLQLGEPLDRLPTPPDLQKRGLEVLPAVVARANGVPEVILADGTTVSVLGWDVNTEKIRQRLDAGDPVLVMCKGLPKDGKAEGYLYARDSTHRGSGQRWVSLRPERTEIPLFLRFADSPRITRGHATLEAYGPVLRWSVSGAVLLSTMISVVWIIFLGIPDMFWSPTAWSAFQAAPSWDSVAPVATRVLTLVGFLAFYKALIETYKVVFATQRAGPLHWARVLAVPVFAFVTFLSARTGWAYAMGAGAGRWGTGPVRALEEAAYLQLNESNTLDGLANGVRHVFSTELAARINALRAAAGLPVLSASQIDDLVRPLDNPGNDPREFLRRTIGALTGLDTARDEALRRLGVAHVEGRFADIAYRRLMSNDHRFLSTLENVRRALRETLDEMTRTLDREVGDALSRRSDGTLPAATEMFWNNAGAHMARNLDVNVVRQMDVLARRHPVLGADVNRVHAAVAGLSASRGRVETVESLKDAAASLNAFFAELQRTPLVPQPLRRLALSYRPDFLSGVLARLPAGPSDRAAYGLTDVLAAQEELRSQAQSALVFYRELEGLKGLHREAYFTQTMAGLMAAAPAKLASLYQDRSLPLLRELASRTGTGTALTGVDNALEALRRATPETAPEALAALTRRTEEYLQTAFDFRRDLLADLPGHPRRALATGSTPFNRGDLARAVEEALTPEREGLRSAAERADRLHGAYQTLERELFRTLSANAQHQLEDFEKLVPLLMELPVHPTDRPADSVLTWLVGAVNTVLSLYFVPVGIDSQWVRETLLNQNGRTAPVVQRLAVVHYTLVTPSIHTLTNGDAESLRQLDALFRQTVARIDNVAELGEALENYFRAMDEFSARLPGVRRTGAASVRAAFDREMVSYAQKSQILRTTRPDLPGASIGSALKAYPQSLRDPKAVEALSRAIGAAYGQLAVQWKEAMGASPREAFAAGLERPRFEAAAGGESVAAWTDLLRRQHHSFSTLLSRSTAGAGLADRLRPEAYFAGVRDEQDFILRLGDYVDALRDVLRAEARRVGSPYAAGNDRTLDTLVKELRDAAVKSRNAVAERGHETTSGILSGNPLTAIINLFTGSTRIGLERAYQSRNLSVTMAETLNAVFDHCEKVAAEFPRELMANMNAGRPYGYWAADPAAELGGALQRFTDDQRRLMALVKWQVLQNAEQHGVPASDRARLASAYDGLLEGLGALAQREVSAGGVDDSARLLARSLNYASAVERIWNEAFRLSPVATRSEPPRVRLVPLLREAMTRDPAQGARTADAGVALARLSGELVRQVQHALDFQPTAAGALGTLLKVPAAVMEETPEARRVFARDAEAWARDLALLVQNKNPRATVESLAGRWAEAGSWDSVQRREELLRFADRIDALLTEINARHSVGELRAMLEKNLGRTADPASLIERGFYPLTDFVSRSLGDAPDPNPFRAGVFPALTQNLLWTGEPPQNAAELARRMGGDARRLLELLGRVRGTPAISADELDRVLIGVGTDGDLAAAVPRALAWLDRALQREAGINHEPNKLVRAYQSASRQSVLGAAAEFGPVRAAYREALRTVEAVYAREQERVVDALHNWPSDPSPERAMAVLRAFELELVRLEQAAPHVGPVSRTVMDAMRSALGATPEVSAGLRRALREGATALSSAVARVEPDRRFPAAAMLKSFEQAQSALARTEGGGLTASHARTGLANAVLDLRRSVDRLLTHQAVQRDVLLGGGAPALGADEMFGGSFGRALRRALQSDLVLRHQFLQRDARLIDPALSIPSPAVNALTDATLEGVKSWMARYGADVDRALVRGGVLHHAPGLIGVELERVLSSIENPLEAIEKGTSLIDEKARAALAETHAWNVRRLVFRDVFDSGLRVLSGASPAALDAFHRDHLRQFLKSAAWLQNKSGATADAWVRGAHERLLAGIAHPGTPEGMETIARRLDALLQSDRWGAPIRSGHLIEKIAEARLRVSGSDEASARHVGARFFIATQEILENAYRFRVETFQAQAQLATALPEGFVARQGLQVSHVGVGENGRILVFLSDGGADAGTRVDVGVTDGPGARRSVETALPPGASVILVHRAGETGREVAGDLYVARLGAGGPSAAGAVGAYENVGARLGQRTELPRALETVALRGSPEEFARRLKIQAEGLADLAFFLSRGDVGVRDDIRALADKYFSLEPAGERGLWRTVTDLWRRGDGTQSLRSAMDQNRMGEQVASFYAEVLAVLKSPAGRAGGTVLEFELKQLRQRFAVLAGTSHGARSDAVAAASHMVLRGNEMVVAELTSPARSRGDLERSLLDALRTPARWEDIGRAHGAIAQRVLDAVATLAVRHGMALPANWEAMRAELLAAGQELRAEATPAAAQSALDRLHARTSGMLSAMFGLPAPRAPLRGSTVEEAAAAYGQWAVDLSASLREADADLTRRAVLEGRSTDAVARALNSLEDLPVEQKALLALLAHSPGGPSRSSVLARGVSLARSFWEKILLFAVERAWLRLSVQGLAGLIAGPAVLLLWAPSLFYKTSAWTVMARGPLAGEEQSTRTAELRRHFPGAIVNDAAFTEGVRQTLIVLIEEVPGLPGERRQARLVVRSGFVRLPYALQSALIRFARWEHRLQRTPVLGRAVVHMVRVLDLNQSAVSLAMVGSRVAARWTSSRPAAPASPYAEAMPPADSVTKRGASAWGRAVSAVRAGWRGWVTGSLRRAGQSVRFEAGTPYRRTAQAAVLLLLAVGWSNAVGGLAAAGFSAALPWISAATLVFTAVAVIGLRHATERGSRAMKAAWAALSALAVVALLTWSSGAWGNSGTAAAGAAVASGSGIGMWTRASETWDAVRAPWEWWGAGMAIAGISWIGYRLWHRQSKASDYPLDRSRTVVTVSEDNALNREASGILRREVAAMTDRGEKEVAARWTALVGPSLIDPIPGLPNEAAMGEPNADHRPEGVVSGLDPAVLPVLARQAAQAVATRDSGLRPTAEILNTARLWGLAGGDASELPVVLEPLLPPRLRGSIARPIMDSWLGGRLARASGRSATQHRAHATVVRTVSAGESERNRGNAERSWHVWISRSARGVSRTYTRAFSHAATPALLTVITLPVLFGANLLGLLAAFQMMGWSSPALAGVISFVVAVAGSMAEHKLLSDLRNELREKESAAIPVAMVPMRAAVDVTAEALSDRPAAVERLLNLLTAVRRGGDAAAERALVRSLLALVAQGPLRNDLSEGFDALKSRRWLRAGMRERAAEIRRGDAPPVERYVNEHVSARLALQLARVAVTAEEGRSPDVELRQASYLAGLAGMPRGEADRLIASVSRAVGASAPSERSMVWEQGQTLNRQSADASGRPADHVPSALVTALRVTELLQDFGSSPESRALVAGQIESRSGRSARRPDILIVNGAWLSQTRGAWNEARVKRSLRKALRDDRGQLSPEVARYLSAARVMIVSEDTFAPEAVIAFDAGARRRRGKTLDLFTADLEAVSFDPRREDAPYRVLLMQWLGGRLTVVDVGEATRRALRTARVLATSA